MMVDYWEIVAILATFTKQKKKLEKPEEKYNWKEKENVHFYIWKTKSIPPQKLDLES